MRMTHPRRARSLPRTALLLAAATVTALGLTGCASNAGPLRVDLESVDIDTSSLPATDRPAGATDSPGAAEPVPGLSGTLTIYAAASLTAAFDDLSAAFELAHPGLDVVRSVYDGSSTLATQIVEGADVDVFASADEKNMDTVARANLLAAPGEIFARNTLRIATPPDNPGKIEGLADLANPDLAVVLCAPEVPCGNASEQFLTAAGLTVTPASEEQNVKAVLTKVVAGEADAGLVYATDIAAAGDSVHAITPQNANDVVNKYPIASLTSAPNPAAAQAFVEFALSPEGQAVLTGYGFESA